MNTAKHIGAPKSKQSRKPTPRKRKQPAANEVYKSQAENAKLRAWLQKIYDGIYGDDYGDLLCEFTDEDVEQIEALLEATE